MPVRPRRPPIPTSSPPPTKRLRLTCMPSGDALSLISFTPLADRRTAAAKAPSPADTVDCPANCPASAPSLVPVRVILGCGWMPVILMLEQRVTGVVGCRQLPGCAAFHAAPVTTHHAQPEPHQRPEQRRHDGVPPQRPGEGPEEELEADPVGVLENEDQEDPDAGQRRDRPATQFAPVRLLPIRLNRHTPSSCGGRREISAPPCAVWDGGCFGGWPWAASPTWTRACP